ncbi:hypothetical protein [uncultured Sneathiella sp.]|uniref:hypothetical protein n=1 Tax=uncultured Sneathiella sp. TaxID=879315 RepID=UPI0030ED095E|tara:strand:+ start:22375 stop:22794 length:420 start_codon:yes stop_codon:yes gene_type:complete
MKKLIITAMALSMMAAPAFAADQSSPAGGTNTSGYNRINVGDTTGTITNGGAYSATYGSSNVGATAAITVINDDVHAPSFFGLPTSGDFSYTAVSTTAIGANTYYAEGFGGSIQIGVPTEPAVDDTPPSNYWTQGNFHR